MSRPAADLRSPASGTRRDRLYDPLQRASAAPLAWSATAARPAATGTRRLERSARARPGPSPRSARWPDPRIPTRRVAEFTRRPRGVWLPILSCAAPLLAATSLVSRAREYQIARSYASDANPAAH